MGKIVIIEEKADKIVDKLEMMKAGLCEILDCFTECMEGERHYDEDDDEWDDEYEVKRRRGMHAGKSGMRRGMRNNYSRY